MGEFPRVTTYLSEEEGAIAPVPLSSDLVSNRIRVQSQNHQKGTHCPGTKDLGPYD